MFKDKQGRVLNNNDLVIKLYRTFCGLEYGIIQQDRVVTSAASYELKNCSSSLFKITNPDEVDLQEKKQILQSLTNEQEYKLAKKEYIKKNVIPAKKLILGDIYVDASGNLVAYYGRFKMISLNLGSHKHQSFIKVDQIFDRLMQLSLDEINELLDSLSAQLDVTFPCGEGYLYSYLMKFDSDYSNNKQFSYIISDRELNPISFYLKDKIDNTYRSDNFFIYKTRKQLIYHYKQVNQTLPELAIYYNKWSGKILINQNKR